ncbi:MAG TPA: type VI secretion system-associated protein TagF [Nitrospiria bacterium]|nr:type VI secretion system-associated protein TagF [Nitrospiria bacterium]
MGNGQLGCFGKLPIYPDFIRFHAVGEEIRALDQWFQEGIHATQSRWGRSWETEFTKIDPWNFVFHPKGGEAFLIGAFVPSRDRSGRRYPFFAFLRVERRRFDVPLRFLPLIYTPFLEEASRLTQSEWSGMDLRGFLDHLERLVVPLPEDGAPAACLEAYRAFLAEKTSRDFWGSLYGEFEHSRKYRFDQNLTGLLDPLRHHPSIPLGMGLKFPLVSDSNARGYDLPFWFDRVERALKREPDVSLFFWNRTPTHGAPGLLAFFDSPSPKGFTFFLKPGQDGDGWYDLAPERNEDLQAVKEKIRPERRAVLEEGDISLSAFLEKIGAVE